ncbi:unnamed protein product [Adineta ricciae]|uniref:Uncharacterized protein n=1 Tax=Adineta ricciae TaxID=249248 RepID=A0A815CAH7_ADIRI|nr:unnamed protein product [Adineta ricciae]
MNTLSMPIRYVTPPAPSISVHIKQVHRSDGKIRQYSIGSGVGQQRNSQDSHTKPIGTPPVFTGNLTNGFRLGSRRKVSDRKQSNVATRYRDTPSDPPATKCRKEYPSDRIRPSFRRKG